MFKLRFNLRTTHNAGCTDARAQVNCIDHFLPPTNFSTLVSSSLLALSFELPLPFFFNISWKVNGNIVNTVFTKYNEKHNYRSVIDRVPQSMDTFQVVCEPQKGGIPH